MAKLESIFLRLLEKKDYRKNDLITATRQISGVDEHKIEIRIKKLIKSGKLYSYNKDMISLNSPLEEVNITFDERYDYEGITLGRKGKETHIVSSFKHERHKEMVDKIKLNLAGFKKEIDQLLHEIENLIIQSFNPLDALGHISIVNLAFDPEEYTESSFEGKQFFVELLHNIVLKHDFNLFPKESDLTKLDELKGLLDNYWEKFHCLIRYETISKNDLSFEEQDIYFNTINHFLFMRGDAYPQHIQQIAEEFFSSIDPNLLKKGFTISEYFSTVKEIDDQINSNLSNYFGTLSQIKKEHEAWLDFVEENLKKGMSFQEVDLKYKQKIATIRESVLPEYTKFTKIETDKDFFEIKLNENINKSLLDSLVVYFNSNRNWSSPYDISSVPLRPIIKVEDKYYCFIIQHLIRNVIPIIEESFFQGDENKYGKAKGDYFESKTLELISNILPNSTVYPKLEYPKRTELDGLVIYEDNLFLVEVKGKKRRCIACAKDILEMTKKDVQEHINKPFEQSKRALEYIKSKNTVEFRNKEERTTLSIRREDFKNIFLINVTADSFSEFTTDLNILKSWDPTLLEGDIYPWNVNIYDLLVITEILENAEDFIDYISERVRINKDNDIKAIDELDYLGYYLENGSLTKEKGIMSKTTPMIIGYSENIDRWYSYLKGEIEFAEKPVKNVTK